MGSGFFGGGCGNLVSLLLVSNYPAVINYKIFRKKIRKEVEKTINALYLQEACQLSSSK